MSRSGEFVEGVGGQVAEVDEGRAGRQGAHSDRDAAPRHAPLRGHRGGNGRRQAFYSHPIAPVDGRGALLAPPATARDQPKVSVEYRCCDF